MKCNICKWCLMVPVVYIGWISVNYLINVIPVLFGV